MGGDSKTYLDDGALLALPCLPGEEGASLREDTEDDFRRCNPDESVRPCLRGTSGVLKGVRAVHGL